eukprot:SAG11_NODE_153_length_14352_cov_24.348323_9_plen_30_part_00
MTPREARAIPGRNVVDDDLDLYNLENRST